MRRRLFQRAEPLVRTTWKVDGAERVAQVHFPKERAGAPVILAFHGHGGNMNYAARRFRLESLWPEAIVVYGQGLPTPTPNDRLGTRNGWNLMPIERNRDLKLVDAMLAMAKDEWKADTKRVFAMGHSNGAAFAYLLFGQRPGVFAGLASVAGAGARLTTGGKPCPFLHLGGTNDPIVRFDSQQAAFDAVKAINRSTAPAEIVVHEGGGHEYPGDASERIVAFFRKVR